MTDRQTLTDKWNRHCDLEVEDSKLNFLNNTPFSTNTPACQVWFQKVQNVLNILWGFKPFILNLVDSNSHQHTLIKISPGQGHPLISNECVKLHGVYVLCIYCMPGGVIVGDSGLCCCMPVQCVTSIIVRVQLLPIVCLGLILFQMTIKKWGLFDPRASSIMADTTLNASLQGFVQFADQIFHQLQSWFVIQRM